MEKYFQSNKGVTESIVTLKPINELELDFNLDLHKFIKNYKFSRIGFKKTIVKRLVKKIIHKKLKNKVYWDKNIWTKSSIILLNCEFVINNQNIFNKIKNAISDNNSFEIKNVVSKSRFKTITKLTKLLKHNIELDFPLFISGKVLAQLGCNVNNYEIFVIDGSRRILASSFFNKNIKIYLITYK
jgi:hypothetical protein